MSLNQKQIMDILAKFLITLLRFTKLGKSNLKYIEAASNRKASLRKLILHCVAILSMKSIHI